MLHTQHRGVDIIGCWKLLVESRYGGKLAGDGGVRVQEMPSFEDVATSVQAGLDQLVATDGQLFALDANERSITHKLAVYLEARFPSWDVDCEYNRDGWKPKRLHRGAITRPDVDDTSGRTVFPDIIIHHRNKHENLLVIEAKKSSASPEFQAEDQMKLEAYCEELGYRYGALVVFHVSGPPHAEVVHWLTAK